MNSRAIPRSGPVPNQLPKRRGPSAVGHQWDGHELCERADEERRDRRSDGLQALGEAEHPTLLRERHHLLQDGLFGGLHDWN